MHILSTCWIFVAASFTHACTHIKMTALSVNSLVVSNWHTIHNECYRFCDTTYHTSVSRVTLFLQCVSETLTKYQDHCQAAYSNVCKTITACSAQMYSWTADTFNAIYRTIVQFSTSVYGKACECVALIVHQVSVWSDQVSAWSASVIHQVSAWSGTMYNWTADTCNAAYRTIVQFGASVYWKAYQSIASVVNELSQLLHGAMHRSQIMVMTIRQLAYRFFVDVCHKMTAMSRHAQHQISQGLQVVQKRLLFPAYAHLSHGVTSVKSGVGVAIYSTTTIVVNHPLRVTLALVALVIMAYIVYRSLRAQKMSKKAAVNAAIRAHVPRQNARPSKVASQHLSVVNQ